MCDGEYLGVETCESQGYSGGTLSCLSDCSGFDTSSCIAEPSCGNGFIEGNEVCDGDDLGGETCESQGYDAGVLACLSDCSGFDTSSCVGTDSDGDGILDDGDYSGKDWDNPCTGGETFDCDDNCPFHYNPDQDDANGNGIGDACEEYKGDVNNDGGIDVLDIQWIVNIFLSADMESLTPWQRWAADVNGDGKIDILDVQAAVNKLLGI